MARKQNSKNDIVFSTGVGPASIRRKVTRNLRPVAPEDPPAPAASPEISIPPQPTYEEVAKLAYSYWEARGYQGGTPEEDWLRAEEEIRARAATAVAIA